MTDSTNITVNSQSVTVTVSPAVGSSAADIARLVYSLPAGTSDKDAINYAILAGVTPDLVTAQASASAATAQANIAVQAAAQADADRDTVDQLAGITGTYLTKAAATAAIGTITANAFVQVLADETQGSARTVYQKQSSALVFIRFLSLIAKTIWVDPKLGSDTTGYGTGLQPFATVLHAASVAVSGDTIQLAPSAVIRESFPDTQSIPDGVALRGHSGSPATFMGFDALTSAFVAESGGSYTATYTRLWGNVGSYNEGNRWYPLLLASKGGKTVQLREVQIGTPSVSYPWVQANKAAAIAYVQANAGVPDALGNTYGYFYNETDNGSDYSVGWKINSPATPDTLHVKMPDGSNPSGWTFMVGQRCIPCLGFNNAVSDIMFFGGVGHNGLDMASGRIERVTILYPGAHACIIPGCQTDQLTVANDNYTKGTGYAVHHFGGVANLARQRSSKHTNLRIYNWNSSFGSIFGCHGDVTGNVMDLIQVIGMYAENCGPLGDIGSLTDGLVLDEPVFNGIQQIGGTNCNLTVNNPRIIGEARGGGNGSQLFAPPLVTGFTTTINGGCSTHNFELFGGNAGQGVLTLNDHKAIFGHDGPNFAWGVSGSGNIISLNRCVLECDTSNDVTLPSIGGSGFTVNITKSALAGMTDPSTVTGVTVDAVTTVGGSTGMVRGSDPYSPIMFTRDAVANDVGDRAIGIASYTISSTQHIPRVLTTSGVYDLMSAFIPTTGEGAGFPVPGEVLNDFVMVGGASQRDVAYGQGGLLYKLTGGNGNIVATKIATGLTTNFIGHATSQNGIIYLLGDDGSIHSYNVDTDAIAAVTSGVTYPLRGGWTDGTALAVWGSNDANTSGGLLYSANISSTALAAVSSMTSTKIKTGGTVNGVQFLAGDGQTFMACATWGGTWTTLSLGTPGSYKYVAVDTVRNRLLFSGDALAGKGARGQIFGWIDASSTTPANWLANPLEKPLPQIGKVSFVPSVGGFTSTGFFIVAGKTGRWAMSEGFGNWRKFTVNRNPRVSFGPRDLSMIVNEYVAR